MNVVIHGNKIGPIITGTEVHVSEGERPMEKIRILCFAANPIGTTRLQLDKELREIRAKIRSARERDRIELIAELAVRPEDLRRALLEHQPHALHFSGHGSDSHDLILVDDNDNPKRLSQEALIALFAALKDNLRLVLLNACFTRPQAEAITQLLDCAIGMNKAIGDQAALVFAAAFYEAIAYGRSVQTAFDVGKAALLAEGIPEHLTPELLTRTGVNAAEMILASGGR